MPNEVVFDDKEIRKFLEDIAKKTKSPEQVTEVVSAISAIVFEDIMQHFKDEAGPDGPWKPWSKAYAKHMQEIGRGGNKILQWSGRLRQTFTPGSFRVGSREITWFNNAQTKSGFPYAFAHNEGEGQPERAFMWASEKATDKMASIIWGKILGE